MNVKMSVDIKGLDELERRIKSLRSALEAKEVEGILVEGARIIRDDAKRRAPLGPTGNLRRGVKAKKGKRRGKMYSTAFAAMDWKVAPHAYLVEYGTSKMRARPYFRPAIDSMKDQVRQTVQAGVDKLLQEAIR